MSNNSYFSAVSDKTPLEEKIAIIKQNYINCAQVVKEIANLQSNSTPSIDSENKLGEGIAFSNINTQIKDDIDLEFESIYSKISSLELGDLKEEDIIKKINEIVPTTHNRYDCIINKLKLKLYEEIIFYSQIAISASTSKDFLEIKQLIKELKRKILFLDELEQEKELTETTTVDNHLFFLTTNGGNIPFLESLRKNVPAEYYPQFKELLLEMKNGVFKGLKKFNGLGYFEVKEFKIRITFDKLSNGNYIILDAFMKKEDTSGYYNKMLQNRSGQYIKCKDYYVKKQYEEDFQTLHEGYLAEALTLLDQRNLEGEQNENGIISLT